MVGNIAKKLGVSLRTSAPPTRSRCSIQARPSTDGGASSIDAVTFDFGLFDFGIHPSVNMMRKSIHTRDYATFLELLIEVRHRAGLTQAQLGAKLPFEQPAISKIERGERRVDIIELKLICARLGLSLADFIAELEERLSKEV